MHKYFDVGVGAELNRYLMTDGTYVNRRYVGVLVSRGWGVNALWFNFGWASSGNGTARAGANVNAVENLSRSGATMTSLGYRYRLSKSTQLFAFINQVHNQEHGRYAFDVTPRFSDCCGNTYSALTTGIRKKF
jgi:hypothetical protein